MNEEIKSLQQNETWELVDLLLGKKNSLLSMDLHVKYKTNNTIEKLKVRLVAKGYT